MCSMGEQVMCECQASQACQVYGSHEVLVCNIMRCSAEEQQHVCSGNLDMQQRRPKAPQLCLHQQHSQCAGDAVTVKARGACDTHCMRQPVQVSTMQVSAMRAAARENAMRTEVSAQQGRSTSAE
jgi:hypothetical protein